MSCYFGSLSSKERHNIGNLLVAAWVTVDPGREWPMDQHHFARAVDSLKENPIAKKFYTADGAAGRRCEDFRDLVGTMLCAGLVQYISPGYTHMKVVGSPRIVRVLLDRIDATAEDLVAAVELVTTHWNLATGSV